MLCLFMQVDRLLVSEPPQFHLLQNNQNYGDLFGVRTKGAATG